MRIFANRSYLLLALSCCLLLALPDKSAYALRSGTITILHPVWRVIGSLFTWPFVSRSTLQSLAAKQAQLSLENAQLKEELAARGGLGESSGAVCARVIYRGLSTYGSSFWINVGRRQNKQQSKHLIGKNSPVVCGNSLIGLVEYVGNRSSRVRLITDSRLCPSVRVARGGASDALLCQHVEAIEELLLDREDLLDAEERAFVEEGLQMVRAAMRPAARTQLLAKGILQGSEGSIWRGRTLQLKGTGFNYDYADKAGPARTLRTGLPYGAISGESVPILEVGDLLVTTGLDGVFPPGLHVARVTEIKTLQEGAFFYDLLASPTAGNIASLEQVQVLAPLQDEESVRQQRGE